MGTTPLSVEVVEDDGEPRQILIKGELDLSTAGLLERALEDAGDADVVIDLSGLSFIDSSGIRTLVLLHTRVRKQGHRLILRNCSRVCARTFEVAGLSGELDFESEDAPDAQP